MEDCTEVYGEDSVSEELDDLTKQFRAAAVEQNSNGLTSLFFSQRAAQSGSAKMSDQGHEFVPQKGVFVTRIISLLGMEFEVSHPPDFVFPSNSRGGAQSQGSGNKWAAA